MIAASSTVPRPRTRTPPMPSSAMVRNRPRCADLSSRSNAASSARPTPSGSSTSSRWSPALRSSLALREAAWSSSSRSASSRSSGFPGSRSIAATMTSACSGDTSPACRASSVVRRSPHNGRAVRSNRDPCPCRPPAVWVNQSPGETQPAVLAASVASTSAATSHCTAASAERSRSISTFTASRSSGRAAAQSVSAKDATCSRAAASTPAGLVGESGSISMTTLNQGPPTLSAQFDSMLLRGLRRAERQRSPSRNHPHPARPCGGFETPRPAARLLNHRTPPVVEEGGAPAEPVSKPPPPERLRAAVSRRLAQRLGSSTTDSGG